MKQFHHVIAALRNAENNTLTVEALSEALVNTSVEFYRLSTYLWEARKIGCDIIVTKSGRKIIAYTLKNADKFTDLSQFNVERKNARKNKSDSLVTFSESDFAFESTFATAPQRKSRNKSKSVPANESQPTA